METDRWPQRGHLARLMSHMRWSSQLRVSGMRYPNSIVGSSASHPTWTGALANPRQFDCWSSNTGWHFAPAHAPPRQAWPHVPQLRMSPFRSAQPLGHMVALHTQLPLLHIEAPIQAPLVTLRHCPVASQNCGMFDAHWVGVGFGTH